MRPKVVIGVLLVAVFLTGGLAWLSKKFQSPAPPPSAGHGMAAPLQPAAVEPKAGPTTTPALTSSGAQSAGTNGSPTNSPAWLDPHAQNVDQRITELNALAMNDDAASRDAILAELQNPDKQIRHGALEAAIQSGDRSVVPRLQEIAAQTEDPAEKAEILAAIDYINLPSLTEYLAARQLADAPGNSTNPPERRHGLHRSIPPPRAAGNP